MKQSLLKLTILALTTTLGVAPVWNYLAYADETNECQISLDKETDADELVEDEELTDDEIGESDNGEANDEEDDSSNENDDTDMDTDTDENKESEDGNVDNCEEEEGNTKETQSEDITTNRTKEDDNEKSQARSQDLNSDDRKSLTKTSGSSNKSQRSSEVGSGQKTTEKAITYNGSDNNYLSSLNVGGYEFSQSFRKDRLTYFIQVGSDVSSIDIDASAEESTSTISISGGTDLQKGMNKILITVTAENGDTKNYKIYVEKSDNET